MIVKYPIEQTDPPRSPRETLPTMYDLPSENLEDPGLPDEFHLWQPQLLSFGCCPSTYPPDQVFVASDLNLYYDVRHPQWYKRPDWFVVVGVPRLYDGKDLRLSYVMWQEGIRPLVAVELLSPGTREEDLGNTESQQNQPPVKWEVYERILGIPYYVVFDRYTDKLQVFQLEGNHYKELDLQEPRIWIPELALGLGLWQGEYRAINRLWLRWYDAEGNWIATEAERADREQRRAERLAERLRAAGIDPDAE
jgi:Uma2 family endonuclease